MRTGEPRARRPRCAPRGFTYLWLLFVVALGATTLAALGSGWRTASLREKERELIFRGNEIADAIAAYHAVPVAGGLPQWPRSLDDLVEDRRGPRTLHHLRRPYADPFTGHPDWVLLAAPDGGLRGVYSRSDAPALLTAGLPGMPPGEGQGASSSRVPRVSDHRFLAGAAPPRPAASSPAPGSGNPRRNRGK